MMLAAAWYHNVLAVLFAFIAILLMIVILLQRGKGVGLAGAFGGVGGTSAFGAKTGDMLTWVTVAMAILLLMFSVVLNYLFRSDAPPPGFEQTPVSPPPAESTPPPGAWNPDAADERPQLAECTIFGADEA